jgi:hypothetical protein
MSGCNTNGTTPQYADDYFTIDVTVEYQNPQAPYELELSGFLLNQPISATVTPNSTSYTFNGVQMRADLTTIGSSYGINLTASFPGTGCSKSFYDVGPEEFQSNGQPYNPPRHKNAPRPCSVCLGPEGTIGGSYPGCWPDETDPAYTNEFAPDVNYPEVTPERYIKVILHVFQKEDPSNLNQYIVNPTNPDNYTQEHVQLFKSWFDDPGGVNGFMSNLCDDPNDYSPWMKDSRIRFLLEFGEEGKDIFFHPDNSGWGIGWYPCSSTLGGSNLSYSSQVKEKYVTGGSQGNQWASFLPQSYIDYISLPNQQNAFHVFITRGTWHDVNNDGVPDEDPYSPGATDCYQFWQGAYVWPSDVECDTNNDPQTTPVQFMYGNYEQYLRYTLGSNYQGSVYAPDPPNDPVTLGNQLMGEVFHVLSVDHVSPLQAHKVHYNGDDGCDDTPWEDNLNQLGCNFESRCALTECQIARMHRVFAENHPAFERFPDGNGGFAMTPELCVISRSDIVVPDGADIVWTLPQQLSSNIIIKDGGKLSVYGDLGMPKDAQILVEPGGELFIEGARIYNNCSGNLWQGIIVQGNPAQHQYKLFGQRYQGFVSMQDATVEGAEVAVRLYDPANPLGTSGGVVVATNSSFYNNLQAVSFTTYHNFNPLNGNKPAGNLSRFSECTFDIDDAFQGDISLFRAHASLRNVEGVYFTSCNFSNNSSVSNLYQRGDGIKAFQAGFTVNAKCTSGQLPCEGYLRGSFRGFNAGVRASLGSATPFRISRTDFSGNGRGIFAFKSDLAYVVLNNFEVGSMYKAAVIDSFIGVQLTSCTGYKVEENTLQPLPTGLPANAKTIGVLIQSSGPQPNEEYKNTFAALDYASLANGGNRGADNIGLQYLCNDNSAGNLKYDFAVPEENWNPYAGVAGNQGSAQEAAGNTFTPMPALPESHFLNQAAPLTYFYFTNAPTNVSSAVQVLPSSGNNTCPSKLPNNEDKLGENEKQQYQSEVTSGGTAPEMSFAANMLVRDYLVDSSAIDYDSARLWLAAKGYLYDHFLIVDTWLQQQEPDSALTALDAIPQTLVLEGRDQSEYNYFDSLKTLQITALQQGQTEQQMADTYETTLADIANAGDYYASAQAQNLLNEYKGYSYQPAIILPSGGQQGLKLPEEVTIQQTEGLQLRAVPNPAKNFVDVYYRLDSDYSQVHATLSDISGSILQSVLLSDQAGTQQFDVSKLARGVYLITLEADGQRLLTTRVVIVK